MSTQELVVADKKSSKKTPAAAPVAAADKGKAALIPTEVTAAKTESALSPGEKKKLFEEADRAFEAGTLEIKPEPFDFANTFTVENLEKFVMGDATWSQLMGLTLEQAYQIAEVGYGIYQEGRLHDARTVFEGLVLANPYDAYFHNVLGAIYQELDMKDEALDQYNFAIELDPEQMHAYINRGEILLNDGQIEAAAADLERAIGLDKDGTDPAAVRARALAKAARTVADGLKKLLGAVPQKLK